MGLNLNDKKAVVAEVSAKVATAQTIVVAEYRGIQVGHLTQLRAKARAQGVYLRVLKNTLARRSVEGTPFASLADAMTGQEAVSIASGFNDRLEISGVVLSKLDGDAKGGAALSIKAVTGKPIKFVGLGEKLDALEVFHADRLVSRILGMGDVLTLVEKAQSLFDDKETTLLQQKLKKNQFDLEDFLAQMQQLKKLGSVESIMGMIPGMGKMMKQMKGAQPSENEIKRIEAIIRSMTPGERANHGIINGSRRLRISKGSGTTVQEVNLLLKRFTEAQKMMKMMQKLGQKGLLKGMGGLGGFGKGMMPFR